MKSLATAWLVLLLTPASAAAQTPRVMDYADIFRLANLGGAELSPDGAWVVYEASKVQFPDWQRRTDLYVVSADGRTTRQLTYTEGEDETSARWQPRGGGTTIGFTSTRDNKKRQLFLIRPDGGEARRVTSNDDGIGAWAWSRDGAWIALHRRPRRQAADLGALGRRDGEGRTAHEARDVDRELRVERDGPEPVLHGRG